MLQAQGKFDLKEPYYRQLNPQAAAAAWPQQEQAAEQQGQCSAEMQQAAAYGWAGQQQNLVHSGMDHVGHDVGQHHMTNQWNQQQPYQQQWQ